MRADPPSLVVGPSCALWVTGDGEVNEIANAEAIRRARAELPLVCHLPSLARSLGSEAFPALDLLELYAFVRPAQFCLPTPGGLAQAVGLPAARSLADAAALLPRIARRLLAELAASDSEAVALLAGLTEAGWGWASSAEAALGATAKPAGGFATRAGLAVWRRLPQWPAEAPPDPPGTLPVEPGEARARLAELLGAGAEARPSQADYASAVAAAFGVRAAPDAPTLVLAEAGTGTGKTLGYIAPASLWAERNGTPVWISTYTRNLQRQIDQELDRLFPDPEEKAAKVAVRKGRENYLCLLNYEEAVGRAPAMAPRQAIGLALMARWLAATRDGDLGGDLPAWLPQLFGAALTSELADRRGECIYSACVHYDRCFVERSVRRARKAELVIANHALVLTQTIQAADGAAPPTRYVFDEGHHLFDAADAAFAQNLSGRETGFLRRWVLGLEGGRGGRVRGLQERVGELIGEDAAALTALDGLKEAARGLPTREWRARIEAGNPIGPCEAFLAAARAQIYARCVDNGSPYGLETALWPLAPEVAETLPALARLLDRIADAAEVLAQRLKARLDDQAAVLDSPTRARIEGILGGITRRALAAPRGWRAMLATAGQGEVQPGFVDWLAVERQDGRDVDVGQYRHFLDPMLPFAKLIARRAHGIIVTSATLADPTGDVEADWRVAEARAGAPHLPLPPFRVRVPSPFDYRQQTRVLVVGDVNRAEPDQVAAAFRELFLAAGGGGLGLFTSIARLRQVHARISAPLDAAGMPLYAQHVDAYDVATLIEIFRGETDSCLLGTDAVRDGIDVPGRSLRLIVFDRVPWPRPTILHKARRMADDDGRGQDDRATRFRLAQAFGRLIRRADDQGVFVILDGRLPSRLLTAFPVGAPIVRLGLADAVAQTRGFLGRA
ncbi:MAG: ATP-dependent DNA helicase [Alphaproteobacteria bacterium]|nr:ATP-dependent DNA helicase [Alphaproteobacteria bacterium]